MKKAHPEAQLGRCKARKKTNRENPHRRGEAIKVAGCVVQKVAANETQNNGSEVEKKAKEQFL